MSFVKGISGNPAGRPKGSKNKSTTKVRDFFFQIFEDNQEQFLSDLRALEPRERIKYLLDIANYIAPKLRAVENTSVLDDLSNEDLDKVINKLMDE